MDNQLSLDAHVAALCRSVYCYTTTSSSSTVTVYWRCQDTSPWLCVQPAGLLQCTTVWRVWRAAASPTIGPERRRATCNWCAAPWSHHADFAATALVARATASPIQSRCRCLPVSIRQCSDVCQTTVSSSLTSACADSTRPMWRCVLLDGHTTPSAIGVLQQLDHHTCGPHYLLNNDNVTISESSNGRWRHTCSGITALCDILVKSAV